MIHDDAYLYMSLFDLNQIKVENKKIRKIKELKK